MTENGQIFIITAPSGAGKTTVIDIVREKLEGVDYSISHTTRKPRENEENGENYYFVDKDEFKRMINAHEFVEWAVVYDQFYGTSVSSIKKGLSEGRDLLMDLDIIGAGEFKKQFPESFSIFIVPPSLEILKERLGKRSINDDTDVDLRFRNALREIQNCSNYDFIVINNDLDQAVKEVEAIIIAQRAHHTRRFPSIQKLFHL